MIVYSYQAMAGAFVTAIIVAHASYLNGCRVGEASRPGPGHDEIDYVREEAVQHAALCPNDPVPPKIVDRLRSRACERQLSGLGQTGVAARAQEYVRGDSGCNYLSFGRMCAVCKVCNAHFYKAEVGSRAEGNWQCCGNSTGGISGMLPDEEVPAIFQSLMKPGTLGTFMRTNIRKLNNQLALACWKHQDWWGLHGNTIGSRRCAMPVKIQGSVYRFFAASTMPAQGSSGRYAHTYLNDTSNRRRAPRIGRRTDNAATPPVWYADSDCALSYQFNNLPKDLRDSERKAQTALDAISQCSAALSQVNPWIRQTTTAAEVIRRERASGRDMALVYDPVGIPISRQIAPSDMQRTGVVHDFFA